MCAAEWAAAAAMAGEMEQDAIFSTVRREGGGGREGDKEWIRALLDPFVTLRLQSCYSVMGSANSRI